MTKKYLYQVGHMTTATREAARIIQRSFRAEVNEGRFDGPVPRIVQKLTVERVIR